MGLLQAENFHNQQAFEQSSALLYMVMLVRHFTEVADFCKLTTESTKDPFSTAEMMKLLSKRSNRV